MVMTSTECQLNVTPNHGTTGIGWLNQLVWIALSKGVERSYETANQINQCLLNTIMASVCVMSQAPSSEVQGTALGTS